MTTTGDAEPPVTYNAILVSKGKIMNDGVKILLERMETHPEEFVVTEGIPAKWDDLIRSYEAILDPEDIALFKQARAKLLQQQFTEKVLEELVDPKKSSLEDVINQYRVKGMPSVGQTLASSLMTSKAMATKATLTVGTNPCSLTLGNTTINESHLEHMKAHLEVLEMAKKAEVKKEVKTIFGKLFNYT